MGFTVMYIFLNKSLHVPILAVVCPTVNVLSFLDILHALFRPSPNVCGVLPWGYRTIHSHCFREL